MTTDFDQEQYLSLSTRKRSGETVATPVWFAALDGRYYVFTAGNSVKVKRLRNFTEASIAPCSFNGTLSGAWIDAEARLIDDSDVIDRAHLELRNKYGWQMWIADVGAKLTGRYDKRAYIEISLTQPA